MLEVQSGRLSAQRFFESVSAQLTAGRTTARSVVITHLLPDRPHFLRAIDRLAPVACLFPKPKTADPMVLATIRHRYPVEALSRTIFGNAKSACALIDRYVSEDPFVLVDIGGYGADVHLALSEHYGPRYLGVVEDTENGHQRYEKLSHRVGAPIISVARSPLKGPEDFLVGHSVVFSVEALLREQGDILHGRTACVIGYGKIGSSIAALLHARHVRTTVFDTDPLKVVDALAHGHSVKASKEEALKGAGVVFCATGNKALSADDFSHLESGAYVATVTSSEDELCLKDTRNRYEVSHVSEYTTRYRNATHCFFVLNRGQAVNFIHGAAVGPFIYLVHAEILSAIGALMSGETVPGISEMPSEARRQIAKIWYDTFIPAGTP